MPADSVKDLGVIMSNDGSFQEHISKICDSANWMVPEIIPITRLRADHSYTVGGIRMYMVRQGKYLFNTSYKLEILFLMTSAVGRHRYSARAPMSCGGVYITVCKEKNHSLSESVSH